MGKQKTFYITTPIYYPSDKLHIGHAFTTTLADVIAKYKKEKGYDVRFLTGTDEHGQKIEERAKAANKPPQQFVDEIVEDIGKLWEKLEISNDDFIRTTQDRHKVAVQKIFSQLLKQGDIYKGNYEGWYCTPCEAFYTETQLTHDHKCPDCGRDVQLVKEEAYFFKMSKYADRLVEYYKTHPGFIEPKSRENEMLNNFILPGLEDLCVSRTSFSWGIPVLEDPSHVIYVWVDALSNYITALGYDTDHDELYQKYWQNGDEILQLIGKEIVRFHVIYWPIMLMALGLPLPTKVYAHGWIIVKDGKMSKSKGNVIDPMALLDRYGVDALRYFLTREIAMGSDGVFTPEIFIERINVDLANDLGNLLSRTASMVEKYRDGVVPNSIGCVNEVDAEYRKLAQETITEYMIQMDQFALQKALEAIFKLVSRTNKYIDETAPWVQAKDEANQSALDSTLCHLVAGQRIIGILLKPFLIHAPEKIFDQLGVSKEYQTFESLAEFDCVGSNKVEKKEAIFNRVDINEELAFFEQN